MRRLAIVVAAISVVVSSPGISPSASVARTIKGKPTMFARHISSYCNQNSPMSFVGVAGEGDFANGAASSVTSGTTNQLCQSSNAIVAGTGSTIVGLGTSFIAAGRSNFIYTSSFHPNESDFAGGGFSNGAQANYTFVGAGIGNHVAASGTFIGGGGYAQYAQNGSTSNSYSGSDDAFVGSGDVNSGQDLTFVGAGQSNTIGEPYYFNGNGGSVIAGGYGGATQGPLDAILGGKSNSVVSAGGGTYTDFGGFGFVAGGLMNSVKRQYAGVTGGASNTASYDYATVPGGVGNSATGILTLAMGSGANAVHGGSFVWGDSGSATQTPFYDFRDNLFLIRASGGAYIYSDEAQNSGVMLAPGSGAWASLSDRNAKVAIMPLDDRSILAKTVTLPIGGWSYRAESDVRHAGPMAQDFYSAFHLGTDARHITSIDEAGVALVAMKTLATESDARVRELAAQRREIAALRAELFQLERKVL